MGYLSDVVSDARRNYRVASRDATFGQTGGDSLKSIDNGSVNAGASVFAEDSVGRVERRAPSPRVSHGEQQKPETQSLFRSENVSIKAESHVHGAESSQANAESAYGKTAAPERRMDKAEGKPNRKSRHEGVSEEAPGPSSPLHTVGQDLQVNTIQQETRDDGGDPDKVSTNRLPSKVTQIMEGVREAIPVVTKSESASIRPYSATGRHEPDSGFSDSRIKLPTTHQTDLAEKTVEYRKDLEHPLPPIRDITPQTAQIHPYPLEPTEAYTHPATEHPATQPQVVIGTIEVVFEAAPTAQTSRPATVFNRDPGRYYLRRL